MGNHRDGAPDHSGAVATSEDQNQEKFPDPGLPHHEPRLTDLDPRRAKRAEHQVSWLFILSIVGAFIFWIGFFAIKANGDMYDVNNPDPTSNCLLYTSDAADE